MMSPGRFDVPRRTTPTAAQSVAEQPEIEQLVIAAGRAKATLNREFRKLYPKQRRLTDRAFRAQLDDCGRMAAGDYLPAINALKAAGEAAIVESRDRIAERLERGWEMEGLDDSGYQLFEDLLSQYEACEDTLNGTALTGSLDRLATIEGNRR